MNEADCGEFEVLVVKAGFKHPFIARIGRPELKESAVLSKRRRRREDFL